MWRGVRGLWVRRLPPCRCDGDVGPCIAGARVVAHRIPLTCMLPHTLTLCRRSVTLTCCGMCRCVRWLQLALRHRPNKQGQQRIISFVGSPVLEEPAVLKRLADALRKNTVRQCSWLAQLPSLWRLCVLVVVSPRCRGCLFLLFRLGDVVIASLWRRCMSSC